MAATCLAQHCSDASFEVYLLRAVRLLCLPTVQVPTLMVYNKDSEEIARLVSSDPGDLVGFIIDLSSKLGFRLPQKAGAP